MKASILDSIGICKAKRLDNGQWIEGYIFKLDPPLTLFEPKGEPEWYIVRSQPTDWGLPCHPQFYQVDPFTICRFTGYYSRHDKGERLFEGDTASFQLNEDGEVRTGSICMLNGCWGITWGVSQGAAQLMLDSIPALPNGVKITGNIFDGRKEEEA